MARGPLGIKRDKDWESTAAAAKYVALLVRLDDVATVVNIYRRAFRKGDLALCWRMREDIQNRISGVPWRALNPSKDGKQNDIYSDNRVQLAIQSLHLSQFQPAQLAKHNGINADSGLSIHTPAEGAGDAGGGSPSEKPAAARMVQDANQAPKHSTGGDGNLD